MIGERAAQAHLERAIARHRLCGHVAPTDTMSDPHDTSRSDRPVSIAGNVHTVVVGDHTTVVIPRNELQLERFVRERFGKTLASCTNEELVAARDFVRASIDY